MLDVFLRAFDYNNGGILLLVENKLLGPPRLSQARVGNVTCTISKYFSSYFNVCYPYYNLDRDAAARQQQQREQGKTLTGKMGTYWFGQFHQVVVLSFSAEENLKTVNELRSSNWINRATRAVLIEFSIYNANLDMLCFVE